MHILFYEIAQQRQLNSKVMYRIYLHASRRLSDNVDRTKKTLMKLM